MACCWASVGDVDEARRRHRAIEMLLTTERRNQWRTITLLLLGLEGAGKSTFIKQMKILKNGGYKKEERLAYLPLINERMISAMHTLIYAMETLSIDYGADVNVENAIMVQQLEPTTNLNPGQKEALRCLAMDKGIQICYNRRQEYQLSDNGKYFIDNLQRIVSLDYTPSHQDILRVQTQRTGVIEYVFDHEDFEFRLIDVSGVDCERRKWVHYFENVTGMIFLIAMNEYDQHLPQGGCTKLDESRSLLARIVQSRWLKRPAVILFFNKKDLLKEKVQYSHLRRHYPTYDGPDQDYHEAASFICDLFQATRQAVDCNPEREVYRHYTEATDTNNMEVIFDCMVDSILSNNLKDYNLL